VDGAAGVKRVLITGAGGFIGAALSERLRSRSDVVLVGGWSARLELTDARAVRSRLVEAAPDVVVHAAGRTVGDENALIRDNVLATQTLVKALAATAPDARLLVMSSAAVYGPSPTREPWRESDSGRPTDAYGRAKLAAEQAAFEAVRRNGLKVGALRLFNVIAPSPGGRQVFSAFLAKAAAALAGRSRRPVRLGPLEAIRDFVALEDALGVAEAMIEREAWGEPINVCTGVGRPIRDLVEEVAALVGVEVEAEPGAGRTGVDWSVGDPGLCAARLGVVPSANLLPLLARAAAWARAAAETEGADARSEA
jgi:GDP-4-dehydro-6-deoxy-D-mannose reductase